MALGTQSSPLKRSLVSSQGAQKRLRRLTRQCLWQYFWRGMWIFWAQGPQRTHARTHTVPLRPGDRVELNWDDYNVGYM